MLEPNDVENNVSFNVSFPPKLGMPIHLMILLRSPEFKTINLDQGQGQITLKTFGNVLQF